MLWYLLMLHHFSPMFHSKKTVEYLCELIKEELPAFPIPLNQFKQLVYACTKDVQLMFNGKFYIQCGGISMGSPLAPLLADTYMYQLETTGLKPIIDKASTYKRYVDDGFATIPRSENPEEILEYINSINEHIKFTMEVEKDNILLYLDVKLMRKDDGTLRLVHPLPKQRTKKPKEKLNHEPNR